MCISGDIILFVSSRRLEVRNFAVILIFIYEKTSFTALAGPEFTALAGPEFYEWPFRPETFSALSVKRAPDVYIKGASMTQLVYVQFNI